MNKFYISAFVLLMSFLSANLDAQQSNISRKAETLYNQAVQYTFERKNDLAVSTLLDVLKIEPKFEAAHLKLAEIYQTQYKDYKKAIDVYEKMEAFSPDNYIAIYHKAFCYFEIDDYEKSIENANKFLASEHAQGKLKFDLEQLAKNIKFIENNKGKTENIEFINLGPQVNTQDDEYFPSVTSDNSTLYFTVKEFNDTYPNEDIYESTFESGVWQKRKSIGNAINSNFNEGAHCITPSGTYLLFASDNYKYGNEGRIDIFIAKKQGNEWLSPANMGKNINSRMWDSQPVLSADSRLLLFVSDRRGGKGSSDIYISEIGDDKRFGESQNLSDVINTAFDEQRPFLHPDGKTLYFSSDGHPGYGGKDLFKSVWQADDTWSEPINLGYPINTKGDEFGIFVSADGKTAYISSDREGGYGGQDIYSFEMPQSLRPETVSFVKGKVFNTADKKAVLANIAIYDLATGELYSAFSSDKINGSFLNTIIGGKDYAFEVQAKGFLPFSENVSLKNTKENEAFIFDIALEPMAAGKEFVMKNIFFNTGAYNLLEESKVELNYLLSFLTENPNLKIEIGGHTDNVGTSSSNQVLSEKRALAVQNYFVEKGIAKDRITAKGYGDTKPMVANDSEKNKAKNRRTSFKVISL